MGHYTFKGRVKAIRAGSPSLQSIQLSKVHELCAELARVRDWNTLVALLPRWDDHRVETVLQQLRAAAHGADHRTVGQLEEVQSIPLDQIRMGQVRTAHLPPELESRARKIHDVLGEELAHASYDMFNENLRRDADPARELAVWESLASMLGVSLSNRVTNPAQRLGHFNILLMFSLGRFDPAPTDHVSAFEIRRLRQIYGRHVAHRHM